jgi:hypothetical protein
MATKKETKKVEPKKVETKKVEPKKIILVSSNPNLSVFHLGVQFTDGKFETVNRELADIILKYDGVFEL